MDSQGKGALFEDAVSAAGNAPDGRYRTIDTVLACCSALAGSDTETDGAVSAAPPSP